MGERKCRYIAAATFLPRKEPLFVLRIGDRVGPTADLDAEVKRKIRCCRPQLNSGYSIIQSLTFVVFIEIRMRVQSLPDLRNFKLRNIRK
jgi:hypothetical protein